MEMLGLLCLPSPVVPLGKFLGTADTFPCSAARSPGGDKMRSEPGSEAAGKARERGREPSEEKREGVTEPRETLWLFAQVQEHFLGLLLHPALLPGRL